MIESNIDDGEELYSLGLEKNGVENGMMLDKDSAVEGANNSERKVAGADNYITFEIFFI